MKTLVVVIVIFAFSSACKKQGETRPNNDITISDHSPKETTILVERGVGNKFNLECQSDKRWEHCEFFNENSDKVCKSYWNGKNVEPKKENGVKYIGGGVQDNWCKVEIEVQGSIGGKWTCKLSNAEGNSEKHFNVQVKGGPTVNGKATDDGTNRIEVIRNAILIFTFGVTSVLVIGCVFLLPQLLRK